MPCRAVRCCAVALPLLLLRSHSSFTCPSFFPLLLLSGPPRHLWSLGESRRGYSRFKFSLTRPVRPGPVRPGPARPGPAWPAWQALRLSACLPFPPPATNNTNLVQSFNYTTSSSGSSSRRQRPASGRTPAPPACAALRCAALPACPLPLPSLPPISLPPLLTNTPLPAPAAALLAVPARWCAKSVRPSVRLSVVSYRY